MDSYHLICWMLLSPKRSIQSCSVGLRNVYDHGPVLESGFFVPQISLGPLAELILTVAVDDEQPYKGGS